MGIFEALWETLVGSIQAVIQMLNAIWMGLEMVTTTTNGMGWYFAMPITLGATALFLRLLIDLL